MAADFLHPSSFRLHPFDGWVLCVTDQPCSYGLGVVFKENDQVAAYNAIVDPDITGVATNGTIGRANPFPITSGSSCRVPFFTTLPGFETAVTAIAPCSSADWTAEQGGLPYSFDGYYANGDEWNYSQYESVTIGGGAAMPGISPTFMGEEQEDESEEQEEEDEPPDMDLNGTGFYTCSCGCPYLIVFNAISVDCGGSAVLITDPPSNPDKIPLGRPAEVGVASKIYVPTKYGGTLSVLASVGRVELYYNDGGDITGSNWADVTKVAKKVAGPGQSVTYEVPAEGGTITHSHGWYAVKLVGAGQATIGNTFIQIGQASTAAWDPNNIVKPWNGWYWPNYTVFPPHLYDEGGVMDKYDDFVDTKWDGTTPWDDNNPDHSARHWEYAKRRTEKQKEFYLGRCHAWTPAAIKEPKPSVGDTYTDEEEAKALAILAYDDVTKHKYVETYDGLRNDGDGPSQFQYLLEHYIKVQHLCLNGDMSKYPNQVWYHPLYYYKAVFAESLDENADGDQTVIDVKTWIDAAADCQSGGPGLQKPADTAHKRLPDDTGFYEYTVTYDEDTGECVSGDVGNKQAIDFDFSKWLTGSKKPKWLGRFDSLLGNGACKNPNIDLSVVNNELRLNKGRIHLKGVGADATIFVDTVPQPAGNLIQQGNDVIVKFVTPGSHTIKVTKTGYQDWQKEDITAVGQKRVEVNVVLQQN